MQVMEVDPISDPIWRRLIFRRDSLIFHTPAWLKVVAATYQMQIRAFVLCDGGEPTAGVAFGHVRDPFGERMVALPFSDFGDPILSRDEDWQLLRDALLAEHLPLKLRVLHQCAPLHDVEIPTVDRARWHGIDLSLGADTLWGHLHSSARRAIRRAEKQGVTVRFSADSRDLETFYNLHVGIRKGKYRLVAQPRCFFQHIWEELISQGDGFIAVAERAGVPLATTLFLQWGETLTYKFNASSANSLPYRPNDLIIWHAIQWGVKNGYTKFDFGLSDWDQEGLVNYKRKYATEEKTIHFLRHTPADWEPTAAQPLRGLFPQLTELFTDPSVPDDIAAKAGDLLYQYFI